MADAVIVEKYKDWDRDNCDAARVALMNAGFDGINHNINATAVGLAGQLTHGFSGQRDLDLMQKLGSIESEIWKAESHVQLALAESESDLSDKIHTSALLPHKDISELRETVLTTGRDNLIATKDAQYNLAIGIRDDGDKTRALIVAQNEANLNRQLAIAESALAEERTGRRVRDVEVNMTQSVNQTQAQAQQQQQFQLQLENFANRLLSGFNQTLLSRQAQDIVNLGTMTASGTQAAANTQVR